MGRMEPPSGWRVFYAGLDLTGAEPWIIVIYAVSTSAPNPLQAITVLAARPLELPVWVDSVVLRYILIVHTSNSPLSKDE